MDGGNVITTNKVVTLDIFNDTRGQSQLCFCSLITTTRAVILSRWFLCLNLTSADARRCDEREMETTT